MREKVHQAGRVLPVMDREVGLQADLLGILPQQRGADGVERPGPVSASVMMPALAPSTLVQMLSTRRLISDAARIDAVDDQVGNPMCQGVGLALPRPGDDEQGVGKSPALPPTRCSAPAVARH